MWLKWSWWSRMLIVEVPLILRLRGKKRFPCLLTGVNVMSLSPPNASQGSAKALIKFIRTSWPIALCSAKLTVGNVSILKNETVVVTCSVSTGPIVTRPPVLFNQALNGLATTGWYARNIQWLSEVTIRFFITCGMRAEKEWFSNITLCIDFCELHERTVPDRYHLPGVHTTVASFGRSLSPGKISCTWN